MISFLPEHYLIVIILIILTYGLMYNLSVTFNYPKIYTNVMLLSSLLLINLLVIYAYDLSMGIIIFNHFFCKNNTIVLLNICLVVLVGFYIFSIYHYQRLHHLASFEYLLLVLFSLLSLCLLISAREFISFYFILEFQGVCFYLLAAFNRLNKNSILSGIKYFILNSLISVIFLIGFSILYLYTGLTYFEDLYSIFYYIDTFTLHYGLSFQYISTLGILLITLTLFFKLYIVPFHFWVADVYEGAPFSSVIFFSTVPLINLFYVFYIFYNIFFQFFSLWYSVILVASIASLLAGSIGGMYESSIKRIFAYSSITTGGLVLTSFALYSNHSSIYTMHVLDYILSYSLNALGVFAVFSTIQYRSYTYNDSFDIFSGLYKRNTTLSLLLIFFVFNLTGIPPFFVFFAKLEFLTNLSLFIEGWLLIFVVLFVTVLNFVFYLRFIKILIFSNSSNIAYSFGNSNVLSLLCVLSLILSQCTFINLVGDFLLIN